MKMRINAKKGKMVCLPGVFFIVEFDITDLSGIDQRLPIGVL